MHGKIMAHHGRGPQSRFAVVERIITLLTLLVYCSNIPALAASSQTWSLEAERPVMVDDLDRPSLQLGLQRSLDYLRRIPPDRGLPFGDRRLSVTTLRHTLEAFEQVLAQAPTPEALNAALYEQFEVVQAAGRNGQGNVLFTGYHEIMLKGSLQPTEEFTYPLYAPPADLLAIDLGLFHPRYAGEQLVARYDDGKILPYFTRREIDTEGKLRGRGLELAWLRDAVEGFFLHVEGSGQIHLPDGQTLYLNYAASNGHPYRSIGRLLLDEGRLTQDSMSLQELRRYFRAHPQERLRVLSANPRYIFFRQVDQGPRGSLDFILVPGRSIATDSRLFPPAGLAFIQTQKPILNAQGEITGWQHFSRFVFNHDTGSAITGPGRVDLFWGSDTAAEMAAGHMQHPGKLFFLLKRQSSPPPPQPSSVNGEEGQPSPDSPSPGRREQEGKEQPPVLPKVKGSL
jgi:membrane-bound lytic murein transglycosylase A